MLRPLALALVCALVVALPLASALAADPPPKSEADKAHPDAKKVNDRNPMVIHAGPGMPLAGARFEPPKAAKGSPAVGGAGSH